MKPKPYNMDDPAEAARWFKEMERYMINEWFLKLSPDTEKRLFMLFAFYDLKRFILDEGGIKHD